MQLSKVTQACFFVLSFSVSLPALAVRGLEAVSTVGVVAAKRELPDGRKLVLIGSRSTESAYPTRKELEDLGFQGVLPPQGNTVDPAFLVFVKDGVVAEVRSFEIGTQVLFSENYPGLPKKLVNVEKARSELWRRALLNMTLIGAQFTDAGPGAAGALLFGRMNDKSYGKSAAILGQAVSAHLHQGFYPELDSVFTENELKQIGPALWLRYDNSGLLEKNGLWKRLFTTKEKRFENYEHWYGAVQERAQSHEAQLIAKAEQHGLIYTPMGPGFGLLSIPKNMLDRIPENDLRLGQGRVAELNRWLNRADVNEATAVPLMIYALEEKLPEFDAVDLAFPLKSGHKQRVIDFTEFALGMSYSFMPLIPSISVEVGVNLVEYTARKMGSTFFEYRLAAFGRLQANLKFGSVDLSNAEVSGKKIAMDALFANARKLKVPEEEIQKIQQDLAQASPAEKGFIVGGLFAQLVEIEARYANIFDTYDLAEIRNAKRIHFNRFKLWLAKRR